MQSHDESLTFENAPLRPGISNGLCRGITLSEHSIVANLDLFMNHPWSYLDSHVLNSLQY